MLEQAEQATPNKKVLAPIAGSSRRSSIHQQQPADDVSDDEPQSYLDVVMQSSHRHTNRSGMTVSNNSNKQPLKLMNNDGMIGADLEDDTNAGLP